MVEFCSNCATYLTWGLSDVRLTGGLMRREAKIVSLGPVKDPSVVNLICLLMLQSGGIETLPETERCGCAICRENRVNGVADLGRIALETEAASAAG